MRIGMILDHPFPPDDRVKKEALSLIAAGHEVHLLCFRFDNSAEYEILQGIHVHRTFMPKKIYRKLSAAIRILPLYNGFWKRRIKRYCQTTDPEVLHVHDLPLSGVAIELARRQKIPVVIDMHEDYADWVVNTRHLNRGIGRLVKTLSNWPRYEKKCLQQADAVIGVSRPLVDKMIRNHRLNAKKVFLVPNTPDLRAFDARHIDRSMEAQISGTYNLIYAGGIDMLRGLQYVLPHIPRLKKVIPEIRMIIVGDGTYRKHLEQLIAELEIGDEVLFTGWLDIPRLAGYIYFSHIGLYPQLQYPGIDQTIPTKLYQYCALGKPVISNNHRLPADFINEHQCGYTVAFEQDTSRFVELVQKLHKEPALAGKLGENGRRAVWEKYNWQTTVKPLFDLYAQLGGSQKE